MIDVGRVCVKLAGRDAGNKCIIVDVIDNNFVMIDGAVRRKRCNIRHLEPLPQTVLIPKGARHEEVAAEMKKLGVELKESRSKKTGARPAKARKKSAITEEQIMKKAKASKEKKRDV